MANELALQFSKSATTFLREAYEQMKESPAISINRSKAACSCFLGRYLEELDIDYRGYHAMRVADLSRLAGIGVVEALTDELADIPDDSDSTEEAEHAYTLVQAVGATISLELEKVKEEMEKVCSRGAISIRDTYTPNRAGFNAFLKATHQTAQEDDGFYEQWLVDNYSNMPCSLIEHCALLTGTESASR